MKKYIIVYIVICLFLLACGDKSTNNGGEIVNEETVLTAWKDFREGRYSSAEKRFNNIKNAEDPSIFLVGYYGLGWTSLKQRRYQNAKNEFNKFFTLDEDGIYRPSGTGVTALEDSIFRNVRAGQLIALNALGEHSNAINIGSIFNHTGTIITNWKFNHDQKIEIIDMRLFKAISHFAIGGTGNLQQSVNLIKMIDPTFDADITTSEGRLLLSKKIEELSFNRL